jgi:carbamoyltransferase
VYILGISAFYHDSAACLLKDGVIVAAVQEERFTRKKHDSGFPKNAIRYCLEAGGIAAGDLDYIAYYEDPVLKFDRILKTYLALAPGGFGTYLKTVGAWVTKKIWIRDIIRQELHTKAPIVCPEHHHSHAASAFFPSPFRESAILTIDGVGEWATTTMGEGNENHITIFKEMRFPHSLGLLYSAFTYYTGFRVNSGEYKVMGLAPYGEPVYVDTILDKLVDLRDDGSFRMNMDYFNYVDGFTMTNKAFDKLFGGPPRTPEGNLTQKEMDLSRSIQEVTEEIVSRMAVTLHHETGQTNLCLAGGVALNCVANGKLLKKGPFKEIWIQPAAGDSGGAVGAALYIWHETSKHPRSAPSGDAMQGAYLGPAFSDDALELYLNHIGAMYEKMPDEEQLINRTADLLNGGHIIGWFQGRMEYGPRALGSRSIIADARNPEIQRKLNLKIKFRESFRPFAPSVLREDLAEYFDINYDSPYMLLVANVRSERCLPMTEAQKRYFGIDKLNVVRSDIPAVTHVDYSARIQTVHKDTNPKYHRLITRFKQKTGCSVIVNTSFNVRGEPIVCTPRDAYTCFMRTEMDYLVMGNIILDRTRQKALENDTDWRKEFKLD